VRRLLFAAVLLVASGCSGRSCATAHAEQGGSVDIRVQAAASLTEAFTAARAAVPQVRPTFSFAGSQQLVTQLSQGAPADVVATADDATMQRLVDARLVGVPTTFAHTTLVIAVAPGNPRGIVGLADLARPGVTLVLADPSVPAGRYARQVLDRAGVAVSPRSLELDVKATLAKVTSGAADAALVYATDVRGSGGKAVAVTFPEAADPAVSVGYRTAVVSAGHHRPAAEAFVAAAVAGPVHDALLAAGFTA
jgi:molybdate transport system substrate-binding protein